VEQATLRNELKKYKRSLVEAERNVARMAEEIKATKHSTDPSFVCPLDHGMSEEEAALLKQAQEEAEEARDEAMFAKKEVEDLKRELWETRKEKQRLENEGGDDVAELEKEIEELKGINEDFDLENKQLKEQIEQKEDELVSHFFGSAKFRMFCRINWRMRRRKLLHWSRKVSVQLTTMSWLNSWKRVRTKYGLLTRY
jgi:phage host-nuclease inhibitor protein Gam